MIGWSILISLILYFLCFFILILTKYIFHYKLLKELYPKLFNKNILNNYFSLAGLNLDFSLWFNWPIYYTTKKIDRDKLENTKYHWKLLKLMKIMLLYIFIAAIIILLIISIV